MNIKTKIGLILALIVFSSGIGVIAYVVLIETGVVTRNRSPTITNLPDQVLEQDTQLLDAFDLDNYTFDPDLDLLSYSIIENTYPQCGISIDNENKIDIIPESGWAGISHITIEVTDGRLKASDTFRVNVYETVSPLPIPLPFDQDFWQELLSYLDPEDVPTLLDTLVNMFDSDVDDLDLGNFSQSILSLLYTGAGELELFRVYNYASIVNMSDTLWKYECFDQYMGDGWKSTSSSDNYDFYPYAEYYSKYFPDLDLLKLKMLISPQIGRNSMVIPSLFPTPFIMENSISAPTLEPESTQLSATEQNCTTVDLNFTSDVDVNMTYELFGLNLPLEEEINQIALSGIYTPSFIKNKYLQLPPTIEIYKNNNPYFKNHWDILNASISDNDNAFQVASKIRNYLQTYFSFPTNLDDYSPAPDGRDIVDWFCESEQGVWSDFASAFCVFTRSFGVVSRFVNGFNSKLVEEFYDSEEGKVGFAIKYKNLYNWAEIYVPTDISGDGKWIQMDMFEESSGFEGNYNLSVIVDKSIVTRPEIIN
ncbi:MAG: transglutaminase-like domain-containing protein, partial [Promethearchaeota archaeon]